MIPGFRPMLACTVDDLSTLQYPVGATIKVDGIRCVTVDDPRPPGHNCVPLTRSLKRVPNEHVFQEVAKHCFSGLDGELVAGKVWDGVVPTTPFQQTSSSIMSRHGTPDFTYYVFDYILDETYKRMGYLRRLEHLQEIFNQPPFGLFSHMAVPVICNNVEQLEDYEDDVVSQGHEGICVRPLNSPYKYGRSTPREGWLVKIKRFQDAEATISGTYEEMRNNNPTTLSALGYAERSSHGANMVGKGRLGGFTVELADGTMFNIGSGFDANQREKFWAVRESLLGRVVKFKFQPHGVKDKPRTPIFLGFREEGDL